MWDVVNSIIDGAYDLHIHAGPDIVPRQNDILEVVQEANSCGMRGLGFKDHNTTTADRVSILKSIMDIQTNLIGGIVLNYAVGGLNPEAVEKSLRLGAKIIWMPSMDSKMTVYKVHITNETPWLLPHVKITDPKDGLSVLENWPDGKKLLPEVVDILHLIKKYDAILDTCHLSAHESKILIDEAINLNIEKIIVTHPNCSVNYMTLDEQKELAKKKVLFSYAFLPCMPMFDRQHPKEIVSMMKSVGYDRCILFSDFGQPMNPSPVEGYKMFVASLLASGVSENDVKKAACINPKQLFN